MAIQVRYFFFVILCLSSAGQLASDVYLPSLPAIAHSLDSTIAYLQLSVSVYMLGYAVAQVIYGPLSDGLGRKTPLLTGMIVLLAGSLMCLFADSVTLLLIGRFLQGLGAAGAATISRVLIFDVYSGERLIKVNAYLSMVVVVVVAAAPLIGGYIQQHIGWHGNFIFLTVFSVATLGLCLFLLPETHLDKTTSHLRPEVLLHNVKRLLCNSFFIGCCFVLLLAYGAILAWLTSGPELIQIRLHYSAVIFGWAAFSEGLCFMAGSWLNAKLASRCSVNQLLMTGCTGMLLGAVSMLIMALFTFNFWVILPPVGFFVGSSSLVFNNIYIIAMRHFKDISGFAGSLLGCMQTLGGGLAGMLVAGSHGFTQMPLALILTGCAIGIMLIFFRYIQPLAGRTEYHV